MMGRRQILKGGDEYDLLFGWKKVLAYMQRPGASKYIKRKMNKRARREAKTNLNKEL